MKERVAEAIATRVKDGELLGVGTGSTVDLALRAIAARVQKEGLWIRAVPTSYETAFLCSQLGIEVVQPMSVREIAWGFDGADEVDERFRLIKGRGGALLKEKILAARCKAFTIIVDESKQVKRLGERTAVPVEVIPEAITLVEMGLRRLGAQDIQLREGGQKHGPVITEEGNCILDARFSIISDTLERDIKSLVGVVENGLFFGYATEVLCGSASGVRSLTKV
jgi:ribose 5-phosphate isomerase A